MMVARISNCSGHCEEMIKFSIYYLGWADEDLLINWMERIGRKRTQGWILGYWLDCWVDGRATN